MWLSLIKGLGSRKKLELLQEYGNPKKIYNLTESELLKVRGIGKELAKKILDKNIKEQIYKHIKYMQKYKIDIISINDKKYPQILKQIYDPPISLYIKGNAEILNGKNIAIVGCRNSSKYGEEAAKYFAYNLSEKGINIISGLARGIDTYAHIGNLGAMMHNGNDICGKTIAVVGNGIDIIYPKENKYLEEKIIKSGGCIISEYPLGTKPEKFNFPARNRIISGLSKGVLVIEARVKSGTLITIDFALQQGRDVYVVPGNINSVNSVGTNDLIKQGAKLVTRVEEIF
ncbi:MAG: DNA-protecting protein DprA [Clostridiales bacterium]|nr:DNA-protecting protein DprA [Clostridiales bacterium]